MRIHNSKFVGIKNADVVIEADVKLVDCVMEMVQKKKKK